MVDWVGKRSHSSNIALELHAAKKLEVTEVRIKITNEVGRF